MYSGADAVKRIYDLIEFYRTRSKPSPNTPLMFSSLMSIRAKDFSAFITHCRDVASLIVREGVAVSITDLTLRRRKSLGLPPIEVDRIDSRRLAVVTGLSKILEEPG